MPDERHTDEERGERAADLYAEFRLRQDDGEDLDLETFAAEHPLFLEDLRRLDRNERRLSEMSGVFGLLGAASATPPAPPAPGPSAGPSAGASAGPSAGPSKNGDRPPRRTRELLDEVVARENPFVRYRVERKIGAGSMGEVFRVWDQDLRRALAMKILSRRFDRLAPADRDRTLTRFVAEAQVTSQLDHPGIVPVHDFGVSPDGQTYFTMKLVKGRELLSVIEEVHDARRDRNETNWTEERILGLLVKVCEAMAYAHHKGVLHRDLKPTNIMVGRYGAVYVMDWGLARILGGDGYRDVMLEGGDITLRVTSDRDALLREAREDHNRTRKGASVGTPVYMSPEQANGQNERIDERSDVYGLGAILYHLLAGHAPYTEPGKRLPVETVLFRLQQGPPKSIDQVAPKAPAELRAIVRTAMARAPAARFESMERLGAEIDAYLHGRGIDERAEAERCARRWPWWWTAVAAAAAGGLGYGLAAAL